MVAVVIDRTEARDEHGTSRKLICEFIVLKKGSKVEALAFDIEGIGRIDIGNRQVAPVGRKDRGIRIGVDRPCLRLELAVKELVEAGKAFQTQYQQ